LNRSWEGVPKEVRQFIYVAVEEGAISISYGDGIDKAHNILNIALQADALPKLRSRYSDIAIKMGELAQTGDLPSLMIPLVQDDEENYGDMMRAKLMQKTGKNVP
jgi:hypothetical protein